jgi:hypothetical protein
MKNLSAVKEFKNETNEDYKTLTKRRGKKQQ